MIKSVSRRTIFQRLALACSAVPSVAALSAESITPGTLVASGPAQPPLGGTPVKLERGGTYVIEGMCHYTSCENNNLRHFAQKAGVRFMVLPPGAKLSTYVPRTWNGRIKQLRVAPELLRDILGIKELQPKPIGNKLLTVAAHGFPDDLEIAHVDHDHSTDQIVLVCHSDTFEMLSAPTLTSDLPSFQPTYHSELLSREEFMARFSTNDVRAEANLRPLDETPYWEPL